MSIVYVLDLVGTLVFAISGITTAIEKRFDLVGAAVIGFVTAVGGGTLRDVLLGQTPVGWMRDLNYVYLIAAALPISYFGLRVVTKLRRSMFLFDTIGIGLFTVLGVQKTLSLGLSPIIATLMGVVSAVFGGVIRDVLSGGVPLIFRKEIYATACLLGGSIYILAVRGGVSTDVATSAAVCAVIVIRYLSIRYGWHLSVKPAM